MYQASYYRPVQKLASQPAKKPAIRWRLVTATFLFLISIFLGLSYVSADRASAISEIKSGERGFCLDVYHNNTTVNAVVDTWSCNGTAAQVWTITGSTIEHEAKRCLTMLGGGSESSALIVLNSCNGSANQVWVSAIGGYENPATAMCLSLPNNKTGLQVIATSCTKLTTTSELWAPATWHANDDTAATISCTTGVLRSRVACYAAEAWATWQTGTPSHAALLNTYSDGNGYEEWCADFVSYMYKQAGDSFTNGERDGWDEYLADNIQNQNFTYHEAAGYTPQAGDVAYFSYNGGHVEVVAIGGAKPIFIYGDSGTTDPATRNGDMAENSITSDGDAGQVIYYLSPN